MKRLNLSIAAALISAAVLTGCQSGEDIAPELTENKLVTMRAGATYSGSSTSSGRLASASSIMRFEVNLQEIEFELDEDDPRYGVDSVYDEIEFEGPFFIDLLAENVAVNIADAEIPQGIYEEVEFELEPSTDPTSPIYEKSIVIEGTIGETPFIFYTDETLDFEVDFDNLDGNLDITESGFVLTINFDLDALFAAIDLSEAVDGNGDGVIEIYPEDPDGNSDLSYDIMDMLEEVTDLDDEADLDEDGIGNKDDDDIDGDGVDNDEDEDDDNDGQDDDEDDDDDNDGEDDNEDDDD
jgi:hypothetical protein